MNLETFLAALRARAGACVTVLLVTVLGAAIVSFLMPKTYRSSASLFADVKEEQSLSNALRPLNSPQERLGYLQTQADVIASPKVALMVVRDLKMAEDPGLKQAFERGGRGRIEDWLADGLRQSLKVETSQSSIIHIGFTSRDREFSAAAANGFAKAYLDTLLELRVEPTRQAVGWFNDQVKELRGNLERAQARLTEYQRKQGMVSADERTDVDNLRLGELAAQLARAQEQTMDWRTRERQASEALSRNGAADTLPDVLNNAHMQRLQADLAGGEAKLQELSAHFGPNHPTLQRQASEVAALRARIDSQTRKVVASVENSRRQSMEREAELRAALRDQR